MPVDSNTVLALYRLQQFATSKMLSSKLAFFCKIVSLSRLNNSSQRSKTISLLKMLVLAACKQGHFLEKTNSRNPSLLFFFSKWRHFEKAKQKGTYDSLNAHFSGQKYSNFLSSIRNVYRSLLSSHKFTFFNRLVLNKHAKILLSSTLLKTLVTKRIKTNDSLFRNLFTFWRSPYGLAHKVYQLKRCFIKRERLITSKYFTKWKRKARVNKTKLNNIDYLLLVDKTKTSLELAKVIAKNSKIFRENKKTALTTFILRKLLMSKQKSMLTKGFYNFLLNAKMTQGSDDLTFNIEADLEALITETKRLANKLKKSEEELEETYEEYEVVKDSLCETCLKKFDGEVENVRLTTENNDSGKLSSILVY